MLRDLKGLRDLYNCPWAEKMRGFISGMNAYKNNDLALGALFCVPQNLSSFESEKTKEKVSGLFRSWDGIVAHSKIRSFISTAKKRGEDLFSVVTQVIRGNPVFST